MTMETNNTSQAGGTEGTTDTTDVRTVTESTTDTTDVRTVTESTTDTTDVRTVMPATAGKQSKKHPSKIKKPPGEITDHSDNEQDNEDFQLGNTSGYTVEQRNALFERGMDFEKNGKPDFALKCYLGCINGLKNKTRFALLPECLKNIADIYQAKGEYHSAIHFAQAEKLFYETALIETQEIQKKIEEVTGSLNIDSGMPQDLNDLNIEVMRAEEYEHLARLCLDNKQPQLALEYAGKSAKIRQQVFGSNHPKTRETLDFFASLYAEVGKEQYSDSINLMSDSVGKRSSTDQRDVVPEVVGSNCDSGEPVSILRQRSSVNQPKSESGSTDSGSDKEKKQVRFHVSVDAGIALKRREEMVSLTITLALLFVCFLILVSLGIWLYCTMNKGQSCPNLEATLKSWLMTVHYNINRFTSSTPPPKMEYSR